MSSFRNFGVPFKHGLFSSGSVRVEKLPAMNQQTLEARLENPLRNIPVDQLLHEVEAFAHDKNLTEYVELLKKGAMVAKNKDACLPQAYAPKGPPLTFEESEALRFEALHPWRLSRRQIAHILACSMGAAVQGWDQIGCNGANLFFPQVYDIATSRLLDKLTVGVINAGPYLGSALVGCWLSGPANKLMGRRGSIFTAVHFCVWPVLGSAFSQTWIQQLICRLLLGIGMGMNASTIPIYVAENSPAPIRGVLVMTWQMWTAFGIFLGAVFNVVAWNWGSNNWRYMLGAPCIPAMLLMMFVFFCPESPRWLMVKGRYKDAWRSLVALRNHPVQAARDMYLMHCQLQLERQLMQLRSCSRVDGPASSLQRLKELFSVPRIRRASLAAVTVMFSQQLCGINILAFYSTTVFRESGSSEFQALLASFGFGLVNWLFSFPAFYTIDSYGRRTLLLFTLPNMMWALLGVGLCTLLPMSTLRTSLIAVFVYLFTCFYSPGEGPIPFTYSAEVFPQSHRELGMSSAVATCFFFAAIVGVTFPFLVQATGTLGVFAVYSGFNLAAFVLIFLLVPETKQKTFEELNAVFSIPSSTFARYQATEVLPYTVRRWMLWQRQAELRPLYAARGEPQEPQELQELQELQPWQPCSPCRRSQRSRRETLLSSSSTIQEACKT